MLNSGVGSWPARRARMTPGRTAFVCEDRSLTYAELHERTTKLASRLREAGIRAGDRVAYLGPNDLAFAETMFATHLLGAVFVPLNVRLAPPEIAFMLGHCGAKVLVHAPHIPLPDVSGLLVISLPDLETWLAEGDGSPIDVPVALDDVALILYTSGTTGRPKGAVLTHGNLVWNTVNVLAGIDVRGDEVTLISAPLFHVAALNQTLLPTFLKGGCSIIMRSWDVDRCYDLIEKRRVTWMFGVPAMYAALASSPRWADADLSCVRSLMAGGAAIPTALIRTYQERGLVFCQGYGLTETAPGATFLDADQSVRKIGSAGVPVFFTDVRVVGPDLADAATGQPGEVLIQGPNVSPGYWNDEAATAAAFSPGGWFRSGDVATVDDEGYLYIVDRVKDMYISGGENVYPAEVEGVIFEHPAVADVAVVGVPDARWGEVGRAFVVCRRGETLTEPELNAWLRERLAAYKIPRHLDLVDDLPRTGSGKIRKPELRGRPLT